MTRQRLAGRDPSTCPRGYMRDSRACHGQLPVTRRVSRTAAGRHTRACTCLCIRTRACASAHVCTSMLARGGRLDIRAQACMCMNVACLRALACAHVRTCTHMYAHARTTTCTQMRTHVRTCMGIIMRVPLEREGFPHERPNDLSQSDWAHPSMNITRDTLASPAACLYTLASPMAYLHTSASPAAC